MPRDNNLARGRGRHWGLLWDAYVEDAMLKAGRDLVGLNTLGDCEGPLEGATRALSPEFKKIQRLGVISGTERTTKGRNVNNWKSQAH